MKQYRKITVVLKCGIAEKHHWWEPRSDERHEKLLKKVKKNTTMNRQWRSVSNEAYRQSGIINTESETDLCKCHVTETTFMNTVYNMDGETATWTRGKASEWKIGQNV